MTHFSVNSEEATSQLKSGKMEEKTFILEFLEVYRSLSALWNVKGKEYSNRNLKNEQYEILLTKYKEKYPDATKKEVSQKINCLRTGYRREFKRISALERSGSGISEENDPSLYYFEAMDFLRDNEQPCPSRSNVALENETEDEETPSKRKKTDPSDELITLAAKRLMQPVDEFKGIGNTWAIKLKKLDETQRKYAEKFINDILFEAEMGTLHRNAMSLHVEDRTSTPQSYTRDFTPTVSGNSSRSRHNSDSNNSYINNFGRSSTVQIPMVSGQSVSSDDGSGTFLIEAPLISPQNTNLSWDPTPQHARTLYFDNPRPQHTQQKAVSDTAHYFATFK